MLRETFIHLPGVGPKTEMRLWGSGAVEWSDLVNTPLGNREEVLWLIQESERAYNSGEMGFFVEHLPPGERWRPLVEFRDTFASLDIETTGIGRCDEITVIGLETGGRCRTFVKGINLDDAVDAIESCSGLITFNGAQFDLPVIRRAFHGIRLPRAHIDLRFAARRAGLKGGLKAVERLIGLTRAEEIKDFNGFDAVRLWHQYRRGDRRALELLVEYNTADTCNLRALAEAIARRLMAGLAQKLRGKDETRGRFDALMARWAKHGILQSFT